VRRAAVLRVNITTRFQPCMLATPNVRLGTPIGMTNEIASDHESLRYQVQLLREPRPTTPSHNKRDKMLQSPGEERITCGLLCVAGCSFLDQPSYLL
jgi:hypothetical protein